MSPLKKILFVNCDCDFLLVQNNIFFGIHGPKEACEGRVSDPDPHLNLGPLRNVGLSVKGQNYKKNPFSFFNSEFRSLTKKLRI